jgi:hypothetical protein
MSKKILTWLFSIIILASLVTISGCTKKETAQEVEIPANYTTFTDEQGLYSISYPSDWELLLSLLTELEQYTKDVIASMNSDAPIDQAQFLFAAGVPIESGYAPSVTMGIEPMPAFIVTHNQMVDAEIDAIKQTLSDYHEYSRIKTTVGGKEATILEWEGTYPQVGKNHNLQLYILAGKNAWIIGCVPPIGEYDKWEKDFQSIVRSLRILK